MKRERNVMNLVEMQTAGEMRMQIERTMDMVRTTTADGIVLDVEITMDTEMIVAIMNETDSADKTAGAATIVERDMVFVTKDELKTTDVTVNKTGGTRVMDTVESNANINMMDMRNPLAATIHIMGADNNNNLTNNHLPLTLRIQSRYKQTLLFEAE